MFFFEAGEPPPGWPLDNKHSKPNNLDLNLPLYIKVTQNMCDSKRSEWSTTEVGP